MNMHVTRILVLIPIGAVLCVLGCAPRPSIDEKANERQAVSLQAASSLEALGWSTPRVAALRAVVDSVGSAAFMIVTRGQVVAAWGDTARTFLSHSIRKSFMSALVGIAVAEGKLDTSLTLGALG